VKTSLLNNPDKLIILNEVRRNEQACKTFEKHDVFQERAMDGDSAFYKPVRSSLLPFGTILPGANQ
jgi:hypothetical protein